MIATGVVRKLDHFGRVVLPKDLRRSLQIEEKDPIEIFVEGKDIILRKYEPVDAEKVHVAVELQKLLTQTQNSEQQETISKAIEYLKG